MRIKYIVIYLIIILLVALIANVANAGTAFYSGSYTSGLNRICIYNYLGSDVAITIKSYQVCPTTIEVKDNVWNN